MNQFIKKTTAYFLLAVFFVSFSPKELVHEIFHNNEVEDHDDYSQTSISKMHTHCSLLQENDLGFTSAPEICILSSPKIYCEQIIRKAEIIFLQTRHDCVSLRGPPSMV